jgi:hypothetical protein
MNRRLLCLLCLLPALAFGQKNKGAAPPPDPVVEDTTPRDPKQLAGLSLLGDSVQLISLSPARGDTVQSGEWTATPAGSLDNAVLQALDGAVKQSGKGRDIKLYTSSTRSLFGDPANLFVNGRLSLPGQLGDAVRQSGAGYLLLVTRSRQEPALAAALPARILASLEGPGFVLDQRPSGQIGFDGQGGLPVFAPFVSIRVALIDLRDLKLKREQSLAVAARLPVTAATAANPWAATMPEQRVQALEGLIRAELPKAVAGLITP